MKRDLKINMARGSGEMERKIVGEIAVCLAIAI